MPNQQSPILNQSVRQNDQPTVQLADLKAIFANKNFDIKPSDSKYENRFYANVEGRPDTDAQGISIEVGVFKEGGEFTIDSFSTSINNTSWENYFAMDGEQFADTQVAEMTHEFLLDLGVLDQAKKSLS